MQIIIFEGLDKTGKTTIAKEFVKKYGGVYFKSSTELHHNSFMGKKVNYEEAIKHDWRFFLDFLYQFKKQADNSLKYLVIDRSFISEYVYALSLRCENIFVGFNDLIEHYYSIFTKELNGIVIYCHKKDIIADEIIHKDDLIMIKDIYDIFFKNKKYINIDTSDEKICRQLKMLGIILGEKDVA